MNKQPKVEITKPLPQSQEAEINVLGAILLNNNVLDEIQFLRAEDFFSKANQTIFRVMIELSEEHSPIELVTLHDKLKERGELEAAGGSVYVSKLMDGIPKVSNVEHYAKMVYDKSMRRSLIYAADAWAQIGLREAVSAEELKEQIERGLNELSIRYTIDMSETKGFRTAAVNRLNIPEEKNPVRIKTGISSFDNKTGGFLPAELVTVTAGTGVGKTLLAQQTRQFACSQGFHSLYCTAEMSAEQLAAREMASGSAVPHWKMRQPEKLSKEEYSALVKFAASECEVCRILDGELSLRKIWSAAHALKRKGQLHCIIMDYDELIDAPGRDEIAQQRNLIRGAKSLAIKLGIPVIMISQLRKSLDPKEAKKPTLERLYGSGAKSKHSSFVIFVDREYIRELKGDETDATIFILKNRDGRIGKIPAKFNLNTLRFENAAQEEAKPKRHHMDEKDEDS